MKYILPIFFAIVYLFSCKNKEAKEEVTVTTDSVEMANTIGREDSITINAAGIQDWVQQTLKMESAPARMKLEENWKEDSLMVTAFNPGEEFYKTYNSLLRWSPDSTYIMDVGSYGTVVTRNKQGATKVEAGEPDSELALIELGKQQRTRLMFVGPSSEILDAKWVDNKQAIVIGTYNATGDSKDTLMWMIDVQDKFFRLYNVKSHR